MSIRSYLPWRGDILEIIHEDYVPIDLTIYERNCCGRGFVIAFEECTPELKNRIVNQILDDTPDEPT